MRRVGFAVISVLMLVQVVVAIPISAGAPDDRSRVGRSRYPLAKPSLHRSVGGAVGKAPSVTDNFEIVGHTDLGHMDTNGDVWVHEDYAYVGTWGDPCNGLGVKVVDVSDPTRPVMVGRVGGRRFTSAEDVVVRSVSTTSFTGDLLAVGIQRCGGGVGLDRARFGVQFWDMTDPADAKMLGSVGVANGGGGVHELDLFQRGGKVYALLATPGSEFFDPKPAGEFRIVDATDPRTPVQIADWGAFEHGLTNGPFDGLGSLGTLFAHSVRASADGTKAYVSYWDGGVLTFDITDPTDPTLLSQTEYAPDADGDAHSVSEYFGSRHFLLQNEEDGDPRSPAHISYGDPPTVGIASESPDAPPLWKVPGHAIAGPVVQASRQGCHVRNYPAEARGAITVVRTVFMLFDDPRTADRQCRQATQERAAAAAGAVAVVHDWISEATSPQWWTQGPVDVPVLFTDHETAVGMVQAGEATLEAQEPSYGILRVFDAATGQQVASFDDVPGVHRLSPLPVFPWAWSIHNNEVLGDRSYAAWYSNGIVALDLTPLNSVPPGDPVMVGQFIPKPLKPRTEFIPGRVPAVWGVAVRSSDGLIFVSDLTSGLWIVRPVGPAAP